MNTLVIGCGASGAAAALTAARRGEHVTVLERNRKPLKKLGVTGNGRGNLLNSCPASQYPSHYFGDPAFAAAVLQAVPYAALRAFWEGLGVTLTGESQGRVYPAAYLASVAVDALLLALRRSGVQVLPAVQAVVLEKSGPHFVVQATQSLYGDDQPKAGGKLKKGALLGEKPLTLSADRVIVAAGGSAAPTHGTDGSAYALLTALGHPLIPPRPALCALTTQAAPIHGLSGQRVRAALSLLSPRGKLLAQSSGEALFAEDGVSGIAAMQLARFAAPDCELRMDLREAVFGNLAPCPDPLAALEARVLARKELPLRELFTGAVSPGLAAALFRAAGLKELSCPAGMLSSAQRKALAGTVSGFALPVTGTRGFDAAQVSAGGIATEVFDPATLQSRLTPELYATGEMLDVDGDCGGFNLMFAVASGILAGGGRK